MHSRILEAKKAEFSRLFASKHDFSQAIFCAHHLLKKGWHNKPWERRGTIYAQQTAFVTNLIVAYARPFTKGNGWGFFPRKLVKFSKKQQDMHEHILQLRHQIFAHSDSSQFSFRPIQMGELRTTIEGVPFAVLSADEIKCIIEMLECLIRVTVNRLNELHLELAETLS